MRDLCIDCFENIENSLGIEINTPPEALMLGFGLTSKCNFNCPICFYHSYFAPNKNTELSLEIIKDILHNLKKLYLINLSLEGEPLLHSRIIEILELVGNHAENVILCSNGSIFSDKICQILKRLPGFKLILSLDAGDAQTYSFMRKGGDFEKFQRNAVKFRKYLGDKVEFSCVVCDRNVESLKLVPKLAASLGIKNVTLSVLIETDYTKDNGILSLSNQSLKVFFAEMKELGKKDGVEISYPDLSKGKYICHVPFIYTSILSDGSIFPCCGDFKPEKVDTHDYNGIFNHRYLTSIRGNLLSNSSMAACAHCINHF